jgi:hypothetical protein
MLQMIDTSLGLVDKRLKQQNMDMRFGGWNVRSLYWVGELVYQRIIKRLIRFNGSAVAPNQQENTHFSMEKGMRTINYIQVIWCIRESCQQLRGSSLLVIG